MPNPSSSSIRITFSGGKALRYLYLSDLQGKIMLVKKLERKEDYCRIDISNFAAGQYTITLEYEGNYKVGRSFRVVR